MRSEPARVGGISLDFTGILGEMKIFDMNMSKWANQLRWDRVFFNQFRFFQMLIK